MKNKQALFSILSFIIFSGILLSDKQEVIPISEVPSLTLRSVENNRLVGTFNSLNNHYSGLKINVDKIGKDDFMQTTLHGGAMNYTFLKFKLLKDTSEYNNGFSVRTLIYSNKNKGDDRYVLRVECTYYKQFKSINASIYHFKSANNIDYYKSFVGNNKKK